MKKLFYSIILILTSCVIFAQEVPQMRALNPDYVNYITAKSNGSFTNRSSNGYYLGAVPSPLLKTFGNFEANTPKGIPVSYDLRTVNGGAWLTPVKNQGLEGACWAFATYAAIESYWKKQGLSTYDLSEQNLATCHGFDWTPSEGGNSDLSVAYLTRRSGPISETDDPYVLPSSPECETGLTPVAYVAQSRSLPGKGNAAFSLDVVKQAIMDNGVLYTNMYFADAYMNNANYTYYYNGSNGTNHGVAIVGWDNSKVCSGASAGTPAQPGAWIIKNSWGTAWGQSGFFYISFYDTKALTEIAYFPSHIDYNSNSQVYYYDDFGATSAIGYSDGDDYGLVKYIASGNQQLSKVGTYILDANTTVSFDIYDNFNGTALSGLLGSVSNQVCALPGYYTFDLSTAINLTSGNDFYIKVRYNSGEDYPVPTESPYPGFASDVTVQTGKYWISSSGSGWTAIGGSSGQNYDLCIKAYATTTVTSAPTANFTADQTIVTVGSTVYFSDLSTGVPTSWSWDFEGGDPLTSSSTNPSVVYNTPGTYDVSLTVSNGLGNNTKSITNYITVTSAPITCEYVDNFEDDDGVVYYTTTGGYVSGPNSNNFPEFAEHYTNHLNNLVTGASLGVAQADVLSANAKITMKIWSTTAGKPGTVLYSEDFDIADFTAGSYNNITFATPTTVPNDFFIGYQIYFTTPQDTFAVYQAEERETSSLITSTAFVKYNGTWRDVNVLFTGGFNTAFAVFPEICPTPPDANFTATPTSGCGTLTVTFTNSSSANTDSWEWDFGDGSPVNTEENPVHTYSTPGTYTVGLTCTNAIGEDTKTMLDYIVVGTIPTAVTVSGGGTQCGGSLLLTASGGTGGTIYWQNTTSNGTSTSVASSSQSASASGTYYFRARSTEGCWGTQGSAVVTINTVPTNVTVSGGGTQCGGTATLNATGGTGGTIYWQNTTSGGTSTTTASSSQVISTSGTYYFRAQSAAGCWSNEGSAVVTINSVPDAVTVTGGGTQCGGTMDLTASGGTGGTIYWQGTTSGGTSTVTATSAQSVIETDTYYFRAMSAQGCWGAEGSANVTIHPLPVVELGDNQQSCGEYITFDAGPGFVSYIWNGTPYNQTLEVGVTGDYTVIVEDANGCTATDMIHVDIFEVPYFTTSVTPESGAGAADGSASVDVTYVTGPQITWSNEETTPTINDLSAGYYSVTVENSDGCTASETVLVPLEAEPVADFSADNTLLCDNYTVNFSDESESFPTSWTWNFGDGASSTEQNPVHTYATVGIYAVSLTVTNAYGEDNITKEDYITIGEAPQIGYTTVAASGAAIADGSIDLVINGGTEPYEIIWSHDAMETAQEISGLLTGDYYVTVTEAYGCTDSETIFVDFINSIDVETFGILVYPNPANNILNIVGDISTEVELSITNILGECIYKSKFKNNHIIDITSFSAGTYFVKISSDEINFIEKVVVE